MKTPLFLLIVIAFLSCNRNKNSTYDPETLEKYNEMLLEKDSLNSYTENRYNTLTKMGIHDQGQLKDSAMKELEEYWADPYGVTLKEYRHELEVVQNMDDQEFLIYYEYKSALMLEYEIRSE